MKLSQVMSSISCDSALRRVCGTVMFAATQRLLGAAAAVEGITRSISFLAEKFPDRAQRLRESNRYTDALARLDDTAKHAATVHGVIEARFPQEPEFMPAEFRMPDEATLKQAAEFADVPVDKLISDQITAAERRYQQQLLAKDLASAAFYSASADEDAEVPAQTVMNALLRAREYMLSWNMSVNTITSLGLLRDDIKRMEPIVEREAAQPSHTGAEAQEAEAAALAERQAEASAKRDTKRSTKKGRAHA